MSLDIRRFSDEVWLHRDGFAALAEISKLLDSNPVKGREALIRTLEFKKALEPYADIQKALVQKSGLHPYLEEFSNLSTSDLINYELHAAEGLDGIFLHRPQLEVYRALLEGSNVVLSAPTSFGKSLLIDAAIASGRFTCVVVIVPTIALIDETRRRLTKTFSGQFTIITHPHQSQGDKNIFILTQERYLEIDSPPIADLFVLDEFYKLSPKRGDERTFTLNHAFYNLFKSGSQFFLIGPNIQEIQINDYELKFRFFRFNFATVATEIIPAKGNDPTSETLDLCAHIKEPTLIFCKSANSAFSLAEAMISAGVSEPSPASTEFAKWLAKNFHPEWKLTKLLENGIAVHYGTLPRSVAFQILRLFDSGDIQFLLCTSTIIEGVNTRAKNIIIYDNKIATKKFDHFTFNNIKGRAGRMLKHFVGRVYLMYPEPEETLPIVDIPAITQSEDTPESLLIQLDDIDLSDRSTEQLRYLHTQDYLPVEVIRQNTGFDPQTQINMAIAIGESLHKYHRILGWKGVPESDQLMGTYELIFNEFITGRIDPIATAKQLKFNTDQLRRSVTISDFIRFQASNSFFDSPSQGVEFALKFLRNWCDFHLPRYLGALQRIQAAVFQKNSLEPGDYSLFAAQVKSLFAKPMVAALEEYGLPFGVTEKILKRCDLGQDLDTALTILKLVGVDTSGLSDFEKSILSEVTDHL